MPRPRKNLTVDEATRLYTQLNLSLRQIAKLKGVSKFVVLSRLREAGVKMRTQREGVRLRLDLTDYAGVP